VWQVYCFTHCNVQHEFLYRSTDSVDVISSFFQAKRITAVDALTHPYLEEGRMRYHSCMCNCCQTTPANGGHKVLHRSDVALEPDCAEPFSYHFENDLNSLSKAKEKLSDIVYRNMNHSVPLTINPRSAVYKKFSR